MRCSARTCAARDSPSRAALTDRIQAQFDESGEARVTCRNAAGRYVALDAVLAEMRQDEEWAGCFNQPQALGRGGDDVPRDARGRRLINVRDAARWWP